jgi:hypothetical protein
MFILSQLDIVEIKVYKVLRNIYIFVSAFLFCYVILFTLILHYLSQFKHVMRLIIPELGSRNRNCKSQILVILSSIKVIQ